MMLLCAISCAPKLFRVTCERPTEEIQLCHWPHSPFAQAGITEGYQQVATVVKMCLSLVLCNMNATIIINVNPY